VTTFTTFPKAFYRINLESPARAHTERLLPVSRSSARFCQIWYMTDGKSESQDVDWYFSLNCQ